MSLILRRLAAIAALLLPLAGLPSLAAAQLPPFVTSWPATNPYAVAVDNAGFVNLGNNVNHRIEKYTDTGTFVTQWGGFGTGDGQFYSPYNVAVDVSGGNGEFGAPYAMAVNASGEVYVSDNNVFCRIEKFTSSGGYLTQWGSCYVHDLNTQDSGVWGIAVGPGGNVYSADAGCNMVKEFNSTGTLIFRSTNILAGSCVPKFFSVPYGVAVDALGYLYVADTGTGCTQKYGPGETTPTRPTSWGRMKTVYH